MLSSSMEKNNREKKKQEAMKTVGGKKRKRITITNHGEKRSWSDLPNELLELIKKGLFFMDQVNFRLVCKSFSCIRRVPPLQQIPWLLVFDNNWNSPKEKDIMDSCKLVDSKNKKTYTIDANVIKDKLNIRDFEGMKVHESKFGWLLISSHSYQHNVSTIFLYSPFFSEGYNLIELPVLNCNIDWGTFTSDPLDKECTILLLHMKCYGTFVICTYRRGDLGSWSSQNFPCNYTMQHFLSMGTYRTNRMYSEGVFYFVSTDGSTMTKFDMVLGKWDVFPVLPLIALEESSGLTGLLRTRRRSRSNRHHYIVKSSDGSELFLISDSNITQTKTGSWGDYTSEQTKYDSWGYSTHHIHRLDLSSMIWEGLDSIGDHVLFIGDGYNSILNSSVLKSNGERKDISDKIYYCKDDELKYCSVHDYTLYTNVTNRSGQKPYRKQNCSRHYGPVATKRCRKMLIDPPPR